MEVQYFDLGDIGSAIMLARKRANLSQGELAKRTKLSRAMISLIERDEANPTRGTLLAICRELQIEIVAEVHYEIRNT